MNPKVERFRMFVPRCRLFMCTLMCLFICIHVASLKEVKRCQSKCQLGASGPPVVNKLLRVQPRTQRGCRTWKWFHLKLNLKWARGSTEFCNEHDRMDWMRLKSCFLSDSANLYNLHNSTMLFFLKKANEQSPASWTCQISLHSLYFPSQPNDSTWL